jgi:transcription initiation factor IIE alpha subunit
MTPTSFQKLLAGHLLKTLAQAQQRGRQMTLEELVEEVKARRVDVRTTMTMLHREGHVDAVKMRLTMSGFLLGVALEDKELRPLRAAVAAAEVRAA